MLSISSTLLSTRYWAVLLNVAPSVFTLPSDSVHPITHIREVRCGWNNLPPFCRSGHRLCQFTGGPASCCTLLLFSLSFSSFFSFSSFYFFLFFSSLHRFFFLGISISWSRTRTKLWVSTLYVALGFVQGCELTLRQNRINFPFASFIKADFLEIPYTVSIWYSLLTAHHLQTSPIHLSSLLLPWWLLILSWTTTSHNLVYFYSAWNRESLI